MNFEPHEILIAKKSKRGNSFEKILIIQNTQ